VAVAQDIHSHFGAGIQIRDHGGELTGVANFLAVELADDVTVLDSSLLGCLPPRVR
jgi:hypothetical protein